MNPRLRTAKAMQRLPTSALVIRHSSEPKACEAVLLRALFSIREPELASTQSPRGHYADSPANFPFVKPDSNTARQRKGSIEAYGGLGG